MYRRTDHHAAKGQCISRKKQILEASEIYNSENFEIKDVFAFKNLKKTMGDSFLGKYITRTSIMHMPKHDFSSEKKLSMRTRESLGSQSFFSRTK